MPQFTPLLVRENNKTILIIPKNCYDKQQIGQNAHELEKYKNINLRIDKIITEKYSLYKLNKQW